MVKFFMQAVFEPLAEPGGAALPAFRRHNGDGLGRGGTWLGKDDFMAWVPEWNQSVLKG